MPEQYVLMELFGKNLRLRAKDLGMTDAEVARLVGIAERRYGFYVTGDREPDLATLLRIAGVLRIPVDDLLQPRQAASPSPNEKLQDQIQAYAATLETEQLGLLADIAKTLVKHATLKAKTANRPD
jgi:transcriptional regulator with XRE-family HTH domain